MGTSIEPQFDQRGANRFTGETGGPAQQYNILEGLQTFIATRKSFYYDPEQQFSFQQKSIEHHVENNMRTGIVDADARGKYDRSFIL